MIQILIILLCVALNAFLAAFEMAFVALSRSRLKGQAKSGNRTALKLAQLRQNPERTLSAIQVGITLVGALAAAVGGAEAQQSLAPYIVHAFQVSMHTASILSVIIVVVPLTVVNVIFAELLPKTLALRNPMRIGLFATRWLVMLDQLFLPIVNVLEWITKNFLKWVFPKGKPAEEPTETVELDQLSVQARQYVLNLVSIETKRVRDVFLPWQQVDYVVLNNTMAELESISLRSGHTRLPVMEEGKVIGIVNTKELLALAKSGATQWQQIVREISRVQTSDTLLKALRQMQEKRSHLSAVFEGRNLVGIVTMEDILEEIIGEVYDEDDDGALKRILSTRFRR